MRAKGNQPSRLPCDHKLRPLRPSTYSRDRTLLNEEQAAHARVPIELKQISQKWMQTHSSISAELVSTRQACAQERVQANVQLAAVQKQANATTWQRDLAHAKYPPTET